MLLSQNTAANPLLFLRLEGTEPPHVHVDKGRGPQTLAA